MPALVQHCCPRLQNPWLWLPSAGREQVNTLSLRMAPWAVQDSQGTWPKVPQTRTCPRTCWVSRPTAEPLPALKLPWAIILGFARAISKKARITPATVTTSAWPTWPSVRARRAGAGCTRNWGSHTSTPFSQKTLGLLRTRKMAVAAEPVLEPRPPGKTVSSCSRAAFVHSFSPARLHLFVFPTNVYDAPGRLLVAGDPAMNKAS